MRKIKNICRGVLHTPVLAAIVLLFCSLINAEQARNEFSIYIGGGFSSLMYDVIDEQGRQKNGYFGHAGLGYTLFFSDHFGIGTGVEIAQYQAKYKIDELSLSRIAYDSYHGENFVLNTRISDYVEKQKMTSLQVPLMFQFQIGKPDKHNFYFALGGKGGVSLDAKAEGNNPKVQTSGYYPYEDYTYTNVPQRGFGSFEAKGQKSELDFKTSILASAEAGVKWRLKNNNALYTGLFLDHGFLKSITKRPAGNLVENSSGNPQEYTINSALNSGLVDKVIPVSGGLKIKLAFGWGKIGKDDDVKEPEPVEEEPVVDTVRVVDTVFVEKVVEVKEEITTFTITASVAAGEGTISPKGTKTVNKGDTAQYTFTPAKGYSIVQVTVNGVNQGALTRYSFEGVEENQVITVVFKEDIVVAEIPKEGLVLRNVNFESGKAILTQDSYEALDAVVKSLKDWPEVKIEIHGHSDNTGGRAMNIQLSKDRANAVMKYFIDKGIPANRLRAAGFGPDKPIADNSTPSGREQNRRVELKKFE